MRHDAGNRGNIVLLEVLVGYLVTFGWAITGSVSMAVGIVVALKLFDLSTPKVDEWQHICDGNIAMAIVLAAVVLSVGIVVATAIH